MFLSNFVVFFVYFMNIGLLLIILYVSINLFHYHSFILIVFKILKYFQRIVTF